MMNKTKICTKCEKRKLITKFNRKISCVGGFHCWCKECVSQYNIEYRKKNRSNILQSKKEYYENNKGKILKQMREYREGDKREYRLEQKKKYYKKCCIENPEKIKAVQKLKNKKRRSTLKGRLNNSLSSAINYSLRIRGLSKNGHHWETLIGYTVNDLMVHLEKQFKDGMNWNNYGYGKNKWCIDHKKPIVSFFFENSKDEEFSKCWSLENLQPLWCIENFSKCAKLNWVKS